MRRSALLWTLAIVLTMAAAVYQRMTGPTYPVRFKGDLGSANVSGKLLRTQTIGDDLPVTVKVQGRGEVTGVVIWRRFPTQEAWQEIVLRREGDQLVAALPAQARMASKIEYHLKLDGGGQTLRVPAQVAAIARFKGAIPLPVLLVHILVMFLGMAWSLRSGFEALARGPDLPRLAVTTLVILAIGGLILGPLLQKYAFGVLWAGWPLGEDLTDNKLAVAVLAWALAVWRLRRGACGRWWAVAAMVVTFVIFMIPHSRHGSTLNYESGEQIHALADPVTRPETDRTAAFPDAT
jgi:hypothetical protein